MKKIIYTALCIAALISCKEQEQPTPGILVKETCCAPVYYAEIQNKSLYRIGDTVRIKYNQMPRHELAFPNPRMNEFTTVVILNK